MFDLPKLYVVIASIGRPDLVRKTVDILADQTRPAEGVMVVSVTPNDVTGVEAARCSPIIEFSEKGLCRQRNRSLDRLEGNADYLVFFDDDFIPAPDYLQKIEEIFESNPNIVGITGDLIADGVRHGGFTIDQAVQMIGARDRKDRKFTDRHELYGCNMAIRMSAAVGMRFDENLPLYGWQEDVDFTNRLGKMGRQVQASDVTGVHLGTTGGRTSGKRLGYSQVANIIYLKRKGSMRPDFGNRLMINNLVANAVRSFRPEPSVDRRGRLLGNVIAIKDCLLGKMDPRKVLEM